MSDPRPGPASPAPTFPGPTFLAPDGIGFTGQPLWTPPEAPTASPAAAAPHPVTTRPHTLPATAPGTLTADPASWRDHLARELQHAHAAVLRAHHAVVERHRPASPAPPPRTTRPSRGRAQAVLASALDELQRRSAEPVGHAVHRLVWHQAVLAPPAAPTVRTVAADEAAGLVCHVHDGGRAIAELSVPAGDVDLAVPTGAPYPPDVRPLARTTVDRCDAGQLDALASGEISAVFGEAFDQSHVEARHRVAAGSERVLDAVTHLDARGGPLRQGLLTAEFTACGGAMGPAQLWDACYEAVRVLVLHRGLHLAVPAAHVAPLPGTPTLLQADVRVPAGMPLRMTVRVRESALHPRPALVTDADVTTSAGQPVARVRAVGMAVLGAAPDGGTAVAGAAACRLSSARRPVLLGEPGVAEVAEGDAAARPISPSAAAPPATKVRPRLPRGDMLMVDRVVWTAPGDGADGRGATGAAEYDMPVDPWYCRESGTAPPPPLALMEMALQPAYLLGAFEGATARFPDQDFVCRNLEGRARLLRPVDARGSTIGQRATLRSSTLLPGAVLQSYEVELAAHGETFCTAETTHGYFTRDLLDRQQGLDGGAASRPWLHRHPVPDRDLVRLDARDDARLGTGRMCLLEDVVLAADGGRHGRGHVLSTTSVRDDDWYFAQHFAHDPVMPESTGVQMLYQALHAFALHTPVTARLREPRLRVAVGEELRWSCRGQILRHHEQVQAELHITAVTRDADRVLLRADGDLWRDGLRICHLENIAVVAEAATDEGNRP
ncbi:3-hydroxyacyl-ACP dehydratase [Streptomyces huasconensis]|uniref:3-hydroxyacyl-ACP dehydratase n=1 Tax=Streptomyces huasconensis TaxID=1854574 RepID=UPI0033F09F63